MDEQSTTPKPNVYKHVTNRKRFLDNIVQNLLSAV